MVDRTETTEKTVQSRVSVEPLDRKVWIKPRLETVRLSDTEATAPSLPGADGAGSVS
jgi:hypothetical protein